MPSVTCAPGEGGGGGGAAGTASRRMEAGPGWGGVRQVSDRLRGGRLQLGSLREPGVAAAVPAPSLRPFSGAGLWPGTVVGYPRLGLATWDCARESSTSLSPHRQSLWRSRCRGRVCRGGNRGAPDAGRPEPLTRDAAVRDRSAEPPTSPLPPLHGARLKSQHGQLRGETAP